MIPFFKAEAHLLNVHAAHIYQGGHWSGKS